MSIATTPAALSDSPAAQFLDRTSKWAAEILVRSYGPTDPGSHQTNKGQDEWYAAQADEVNVALTSDSMNPLETEVTVAKLLAALAYVRRPSANTFEASAAKVQDHFNMYHPDIKEAVGIALNHARTRGIYDHLVRYFGSTPGHSNVSPAMTDRTTAVKHNASAEPTTMAPAVEELSDGDDDAVAAAADTEVAAESVASKASEGNSNTTARERNPLRRFAHKITSRAHGRTGRNDS
jgi:hypothetical protein